MGLFKRYKVKNDKILVLTTIALCVFGTLMIASANMGAYAGDVLKIAFIIGKQAMYLAFGFALMWCCSHLNLKKELDDNFFYISSFILFVILMIPRMMGNNVMGAYAWIDLKIFTIQPSEFAKLFFIINLPRYLCHKDDDVRVHKLRFLYACAICLGIWITIFAVQQDLGSSIAFLGICFFILLMCEDKYYKKYQKVLVALVFIGTAGIIFGLTPLGTKVVVAILGDGYKAGRFLAAENPFAHQYGVGYHLVLSLVSCANGGLFGQGFAGSIHKYMNFPNVDNDFILPVIMEEMGLVLGFGFIIVTYSIIVFRLVGMMKLKKADNRMRMTLIGIITYLLLHFILNVGGVTGFIPLTGVPLLLVSAGGSSIMAFLGAIGYGLGEIKRVKENENNIRKV